MVVELLPLVAVGLRPFLHAAAREPAHLPVSLTALYDRIKRAEPEVLRGSAERLTPVLAAVAFRLAVASRRRRCGAHRGVVPFQAGRKSHEG